MMILMGCNGGERSAPSLIKTIRRVWRVGGGGVGGWAMGDGGGGCQRATLLHGFLRPEALILISF